MLVGTHFFSISGAAGVGRCFLSQFWPCSHGLSWIVAVTAFTRCWGLQVSSADIQPCPTQRASPGGSEGEPPEQLSLSPRADGRAGCHGALAVPLLPSAGRGTGREPLEAEQMMVLSREQIRGMLSLPSLSPSAWLSPWICSIRPQVGK